MNKTTFLAIVLSFASLVGCDDDESLSLQTLQAGFAETACNGELICLGDIELDRRYSSLQACLRHFAPEESSATWAAYQEAIDAGRLNYDSALAGKCATAPTCGIGGADCGDIFTGLVADGGICTSQIECISGTRCIRTSGCQGRCVKQIALGESCAGAACAEHLRCGDGSICELLPKAGEACGGSKRCDAGLYCVDGSCNVNPAREGDACLLDECALPMNCNKGKCTMPVRVEKNATCDSTALEVCPTKQKCVGGECTDAKLAGQTCTTSECEANLVCRAGTCVRRAELGEICQSPEDCHSGICTDQICVDSKGCIFEL